MKTFDEVMNELIWPNENSEQAKEYLESGKTFIDRYQQIVDEIQENLKINLYIGAMLERGESALNSGILKPEYFLLASMRVAFINGVIVGLEMNKTELEEKVKTEREEKPN